MVRMARRLVSVSLVVSAWVGALLTLSTPVWGQPCSDIEVIYARGTGSPPGVGWIGQAFIDSLRNKVGGRSVGVYAVNYPATIDFAQSSAAGANDARARIESVAANCPDTRIVLGGTSQGAGVITLITADVPPMRGVAPAPIRPDIAGHVAAIAVFGNPSRSMVGKPLPAMSPQYGDRAIDMCAGGDPFCGAGIDVLAHMSYVQNGMVEQAANYVAGKL